MFILSRSTVQGAAKRNLVVHVLQTIKIFMCYGLAGDRNLDLPHAKRMLYH